MIDILGNPIFWGYFLTLVPFLLFTLFYGFKSPWTTNAAGRGLMILSTTLSVLLVQTLVTVALGSGWYGQDVVRVIVLVGAFTSGWYLLHTLLSLQWRGRRLLDSKKKNQAAPEHRDHQAAHRRNVAARVAARLGARSSRYKQLDDAGWTGRAKQKPLQEADRKDDLA